MTKVTIDRALVEQAIESMRLCVKESGFPETMQKEIDAMEKALAEPAVEPTCKQPLQVHKQTGWVAHKNQYAVPVLFNPYTGEPRDVRDVQSDPQGVLIVPPGRVDMIAASPPPPAEPAAEPAVEPVVRFTPEQVVAALNEWKSLWLKVPTFADRVNRATREAITRSHGPLHSLFFEADSAMRMPKGCTSPSGCRNHGCHGECMGDETPPPAQTPVEHCQSCGDVATRHLPEEATSFPGPYCDRCGQDTSPPPLAEPAPVQWLSEDEIGRIFLKFEGSLQSLRDCANEIEKAYRREAGLK